MYNHTPPDSYVVDVVGRIHLQDLPKLSPSHRVVRALQAVDPRIVTTRFRSTVLNAIFDHALVQHFNDDEEYVKRLIPRLERRYGKKRTRHLLIERCDILNTWRFRDAWFIPDAFLVDIANWTVVCYEVEDTHPLNPYSIEEYVAAWYNLDYIYWDFHLISYDIYGHPRVHLLPVAGVISEQVRRERNEDA
jgi:hypothetical protein